MKEGKCLFLLTQDCLTLIILVNLAMSTTSCFPTPSAQAQHHCSQAVRWCDGPSLGKASVSSHIYLIQYGRLLHVAKKVAITVIMSHAAYA